MGAAGWLVECFCELETERQIGLDVGPIPITAIQQYADRHGLGELFIRQILEIDRAYVKAQRKGQMNG